MSTCKTPLSVLPPTPARANAWKFTYATQFEDNFGKGNGPRSTPQIYENRVVTLGADGKLHALELETGKKLWVRRSCSRIPSSF